MYKKIEKTNKKIKSGANKINLGCGNDIKKGYINVDDNPNTSPDFVVDLNKTPWPFKDNEFDEVYASHVLEHLENPVKKIGEMHRITKNNGILEIKVPHFSYAWGNITHVTAFSINTFNFLDSRKIDKFKNPVEIYGSEKYEVLQCELTWVVAISKKRIFLRAFNKIVNYLANANPYFCERIWCYWVGGFEQIHFKVKVIK